MASSGTRCNGITCKGARCKLGGKILDGGEWYCKRHAPPQAKPIIVKPREPHTLQKPANPMCSLERRSSSLIAHLFTLGACVARRFSYTLILLTTCFVLHFQIRKYYYLHCESNIIKVWLAKKTPVCGVIDTMLTSMEMWAIGTTKTVAAYVAAIN